MAWHDPLVRTVQRVQRWLGIADKDRWLMWAWPLATGILAVIAIWSVLLATTPVPVIEHPRPSRIYSADGVLLATLAPADYEAPIRYDSLPPHVVQALLAAGEPDYRTRGLRITSEYSRLLIRQMDLDWNGPLRAAQRQLAAYRLERAYAPDTILLAVLQRADFGEGKRGLTRAAWHFLGKAPADLLPHESALLIGLLEAPSAYNPRKDKARARLRRDDVLRRMAAAGALTPEAADSLMRLEVRVSKGKARRPNPALQNSQEPYFTRLVTRWVQDHLDSLAASGGAQYDLETDGLVIHTTLDTRLQAHARSALVSHLKFLDEPFREQLRDFGPWRKDTSYLPKAMRRTLRYKAMRAAGASEAAIFAYFKATKRRMQVVRLVPDRSRGAEWGSAKVALADTTLTPLDSLRYYTAMLQAGLLSAERGTNRVRAYVAGLDYQHLPLDHLTQTKRQPGSAFKPFVYAAALDSNIAPCTELPNQRMEIQTPEGPWVPKNSEGESDPLLSMKCALAFSINRVAVHLSERLGRERVVQYAHAFGVHSRIKPVPAVALGTTDVSVWEMTEAYATLANLGRHQPLRVVDSIHVPGRGFLPLPEPKPQQVYPQDKAYTLIDMLRAVVTFGTAGTIKRQYNLYQVDLAGKTGTTQNHSDGWFMNITPELVTGIWVGCDDRRVRFQYMYYGRGAMTAMPIGGRYLQKAYSDKSLALPKGKFEAPAKLPWTTECGACPNFREVDSDSTATDSTSVSPVTDIELSDEELRELGVDVDGW